MVLVVLVLALMASVLLQGVFAALGPFLIDDLGLSRAQLGTLTTALYVTGSSLSLVAGPVVDRVDPRRVLAVLFSVSAASALGVAVAPSYPWLVVAALAGGLAVALGNPVTNLLVALHAPGARQGVWTGVKQAGVQVTIFLGGALLPPIAALAGWRAAVVASAVLPAMALVVGVLALHGRPRPRPEIVRSRVQLPAGTRWLAAYGFAMGCGISALGAYLALYGVQVLGLPETTAGLLAATVGGVGVVARVVWGWHADRSGAPLAPMLVVQGACSVAAIALVALAGGAGLGLAWIGAVLAGASATAWNAIGMLAIVRGDPAVSGRNSAVVVGAFYFGFVVGPTTFGVLVDASDSFTTGWWFAGGAFAVATAIALAWRWSPHAETKLTTGVRRPRQVDGGPHV